MKNRVEAAKTEKSNAKLAVFNEINDMTFLSH